MSFLRLSLVLIVPLDCINKVKCLWFLLSNVVLCAHSKISNIKHCSQNVPNMKQRTNQIISLGSHRALFVLAAQLWQFVVYVACVNMKMHILHEECHPGSRRPQFPGSYPQ